MVNATGAIVHITQLYNLGVEQLKIEEVWPHLRRAFTCDLWKLATSKEFFTCMAHWMWGKVGGGPELKWQVVTTCELSTKTISGASK